MRDPPSLLISKIIPRCSLSGETESRSLGKLSSLKVMRPTCWSAVFRQCRFLLSTPFDTSVERWYATTQTRGRDAMFVSVTGYLITETFDTWGELQVNSHHRTIHSKPLRLYYNFRVLIRMTEHLFFREIGVDFKIIAKLLSIVSS